MTKHKEIAMGQYLSLAEAAAASPGRPHLATVWRWCRKGIKTRAGVRVKLEHIRAGAKLFVTESGLADFFKNVQHQDWIALTVDDSGID